MYMWKKKEHQEKREKIVKKRGYNLTIKNYIDTLRESNLKIELVEINLNETGQIDLKIKAKEKEER